MFRRAFPVILVSSVLSLSGGSSYSQSSDSPFPAVSLQRSAKGAQIVSALGGKLPAVARWYGVSELEFRALCSREKSLTVDRGGRLLYACGGMVAQGAVTDGTGLTTVASLPESQTFLLHSKPGATRVIYLDFTGHSTSGTVWNTAFTAGATITTPAYDTDGIPASFSSAELANIQTIWRRVSEDYAPFDVNVTTQEPGLESLRKSTSTDTDYGVRVCIGGSSSTWYGASAGGVAYVGSFSWNSDSPAFVFPAQLGGGAAKYVAEAVSHEVGHTVGLNHDGCKDNPATTANEATEYCPGHSNWAPIMGLGYNREVVQFSKGEYPNANNTQDDFTVIKAHIPARSDEAGDGITTALSLSGAVFGANGVISSRADADLFRFTTDAGTVSLAADPAASSPDLDIAISLYDGSGTLISTSNPTTMGAALSVAVPAGTYYAAIDGSAPGNPLTSYNDYGSVGLYSFSGTSVGSSNLAPVAVVSQSTPVSGVGPLTVNFSSAGSSDPDGTIAAYDWDFGDGTSSTAASPSHLYSTPGSYQASLVVFDNGGLSSSAFLTVTVTSDNRLYVSSITMTTSGNRSGTTAKAVVTIKDANGALKSGAAVSGTWSGVVSGNASGTTGSTGSIALTSPKTKVSGNFTFTVTGVSASGATYSPALNIKSSATITK